MEEQLLEKPKNLSLQSIDYGSRVMTKLLGPMVSRRKLTDMYLGCDIEDAIGGKPGKHHTTKRRRFNISKSRLNKIITFFRFLNNDPRTLSTYG